MALKYLESSLPTVKDIIVTGEAHATVSHALAEQAHNQAKNRGHQNEKPIPLVASYPGLLTPAFVACMPTAVTT